MSADHTPARPLLGLLQSLLKVEENELRVLDCVVNAAVNLTPSQIAADLHLSERSVNYSTRVLAALGHVCLTGTAEDAMENRKLAVTEQGMEFYASEEARLPVVKASKGYGIG